MRGHSDPSGALFIGCGIGLWTFFKGFRIMREYKVLEDTPRIPIRSVPTGFVHIRGKAESGEVLASPVSHTPCCFYKVEIDEWKSEGRSKTWVRCCVDMNGYRFHLADGTGKILIDAHAAEYDLPLATERVVTSQAAASSAPSTTDADLLKYVSYAQMHSMTERAGQWIDKRFEKAGAADNPQIQAKRDALRALFAGIPAVAQGGKPPIEALERLANASGPLSNPQKEQGRQMFLERLRLAEAANQAGLLSGLMPSANPAEGRFRLREFVVIPEQEYLISGTCVENSSDGQDRCLIAKGHNEPTFVISVKSDAQIHHDLEKSALLMIFGGAAAALACAVGLLVHFGLF
ncbi:MAG: hypothetical protein ABR881_06020 [Candidatus Sulfotelmatobacter sp.]|jgi:hypothetical protein